MADAEEVVREFIARINAHDTNGILVSEWQVYADNKPVYEILSTRA